MQRYFGRIPGLLFSILVAGMLFGGWILSFGLDAQHASASTTTTVIDVTTVEDELNTDGDCSLREALAAANTDTAIDACPAGSGADTIHLEGLRYTMALTGTDDVNGGDWDITSTLTLRGVTSSTTILDGAQLDRVLHVHAGADAFVTKLALINGQSRTGLATGCDLGWDLPCPAMPGGGVFNEGTLLLHSTTVSESRTGYGGDCDSHNDGSGQLCPNRKAAGGGDGGGIYNSGVLTIEHSLVFSNTAGDGGNCVGDMSLSLPCRGGDGGHGGGIFSTGTMAIRMTVIADNLAGAGGTGTPVQDTPPASGAGGGLYNLGNATVDGARIESNSSGAGGHYEYPDPEPGGEANGPGGGVFNAGALYLRGSIVMSNTTGPGYYGNGAGGGILNAGELVIEQSTVRGNLGIGGGIDNHAVMHVVRSSIHGNSTFDAPWHGGSHNYFCANAAAGGGILNRAVMTVTSTTITQNRTGEGAYSGYCGPGAGGAGAGVENLGEIWILNSTISGNRTGMGLQFVELPPGPAGVGGGIANWNDGEVHIANSIVAGNHGRDGATDCYGELDLQAGNLIGDPAGCTMRGDLTGAIVGFDARLGPLADNGGPTLTLMPEPSSPAVDHGSCLDWAGQAIPVDQRGEPRPLGETCDIGAVESPYTSTFTIFSVALPLVAGDIPLVPESPEATAGP